MSEAEKARRPGGWIGYQCEHESCTPHGICLVGPPIPDPPPCPAPPGSLCTDTGCWDEDRCIVYPRTLPGQADPS